jgi:hypothetical protein
MKVLEELCNDSDCPKSGTHWHLFDADDFLKEAIGEYTVTLRVRAIKPKRRKARVK